VKLSNWQLKESFLFQKYESTTARVNIAKTALCSNEVRNVRRGDRLKLFGISLATEKLSLLERLCATAKPCPKYGAEMRPIHGQFGSSVILVCFNRYKKLPPCKGVRYIESEFADKVAAFWPKSVEPAKKS
jgi:hypothetical protein